jgi:hypothetical protein
LLGALPWGDVRGATACGMEFLVGASELRAWRWFGLAVAIAGLTAACATEESGDASIVASDAQGGGDSSVSGPDGSAGTPLDSGSPDGQDSRPDGQDSSDGAGGPTGCGEPDYSLIRQIGSFPFRSPLPECTDGQCADGGVCYQLTKELAVCNWLDRMSGDDVCASQWSGPSPPECGCDASLSDGPLVRRVRRHLLLPGLPDHEVHRATLLERFTLRGGLGLRSEYLRDARALLRAGV